MFLRVCLIEFEDSRRSLFGVFLFFPVFFFFTPGFARTPFLRATFTLSCRLFFFFFFPLLIVALSFYALLRFNTYTLGNIRDSISHGGGKKKTTFIRRGEREKKEGLSI